MVHNNRIKREKKKEKRRRRKRRKKKFLVWEASNPSPKSCQESEVGYWEQPGNEAVIDENEEESEANKIKITARSGEDAWYRALAMKSYRTSESIWHGIRDEMSIGTDEASV